MPLAMDTLHMVPDQHQVWDYQQLVGTGYHIGSHQACSITPIQLGNHFGLEQ